MMKRTKWKAVLYYSLHIVPLIIIFLLDFTDVLYNFKEPVSKLDYIFCIRALAFIVLLIIINIVFIKKFDLPEKKQVPAIIIVCYLGVSSMISLVYGGNIGIQFYSPDKTNIITFEERCILSSASVRIRKSYSGIFSVPIELDEKYKFNDSAVYADFKWIDENNLYVKIYPEDEQKDYPPKYYSIIDLDRSEIISKEQYDTLNTQEYTFKPI